MKQARRKINDTEHRYQYLEKATSFELCDLGLQAFIQDFDSGGGKNIAGGSNVYGGEFGFFFWGC